MIRTERLDLTATTLDLAEAELTSLERFAEMLGASIPDGWPPGLYDRGAMTFFRDRLRESSAEGWYGWYAVLRAEHLLVASIGFCGPPKDGVVELGYSVVEAYRRRGIATEAVTAMAAHAFACGAQMLFADCAYDNVASHRVLEHAGFQRDEDEAARPTLLRFVRSR
jgi:RimJ/RimL family protein N-acetyltransferase